MIAVLRQRNFAFLWAGGLISMIGNWVLLVAVPFYIYQVTESALATSAVLMVYVAPGAFFGTLAGVFVDRWDRKRVMVAGNLLQMAVVLIMLLIRSPEWVWLIYVAIFLEATISQFTGPAENALLPTLVGEEHLIAANSLNSMNDNLARLVGPAVGGALLALTGFWAVVVIDAITFGLAALMIAQVHTQTRPAPKITEEAPAAGQAWLQFWREWLSGLRYIKRVRVLAITISILAFALFGDAIMSALLVVFVQEEMGLSAVEFGWIMTARGIGGLIGGILIAQLGQKLSQTLLITAGLTLSGILLLIVVIFPTLTVILPLVVLVGISVMAFFIGFQTILQIETEEAYRGRVFGAYGTTMMLIMLIGSGLAGALADVAGSTELMAAAAGIYIIAGALAFVLYRLQPVSQPEQELSAG
ncbi:MAG: MFS transporter [Ardenticatenaceae bacterium]|nr:MFS transporter [Ardenticatenaceae bacterium]